MVKRYTNEKRQCVSEEYVEADGFYEGNNSHTYTVKEWTYHYSDGSTETVTLRERHA